MTTIEVLAVILVLGLEASEANPHSILSGDRNITCDALARNGIIRFGSTNQPGWGMDLHKSAGNIAQGDGSAHQVTVSGIQKQFQSAFQSAPSVTELRLAVPKPN